MQVLTTMTRLPFIAVNLAVSLVSLQTADAFTADRRSTARIGIPKLSAATDVSTTSKYDDLRSWFLENDGTISDNVSIRKSTLSGYGYGCFADEELAEGELLFRIPRAATVNLDDCLNDEDCGASFRALQSKAGPGSDTVLIAGYLAKEWLLIQEYDKQNDSARLETIKFEQYLRTLPWKRGVCSQEHVIFWKGRSKTDLSNNKAQDCLAKSHYN